MRAPSEPTRSSTNRVATFGAYQVIINAKVRSRSTIRACAAAINLALNRQGVIQAFRPRSRSTSRAGCRTAASSRHPRDTIATLPGYRPDKTQDIADAQQTAGRCRLPERHPGCRAALGLGRRRTPRSWRPAIQDQLKQRAQHRRSTSASRSARCWWRTRRPGGSRWCSTRRRPDLRLLAAWQHLLQDGRLAELRRLQQSEVRRPAQAVRSWRLDTTKRRDADRPDAGHCSIRTRRGSSSAIPITC